MVFIHLWATRRKRMAAQGSGASAGSKSQGTSGSLLQDGLGIVCTMCIGQFVYWYCVFWVFYTVNIAMRTLLWKVKGWVWQSANFGAFTCVVGRDILGFFIHCHRQWSSVADNIGSHVGSQNVHWFSLFFNNGIILLFLNTFDYHWWYFWCRPQIKLV